MGSLTLETLRDRIWYGSWDLMRLKKLQLLLHKLLSRFLVDPEDMDSM